MTTSKLGTRWVAPGEGSTPSEIYDAVDQADLLTSITEERLRKLIAAGNRNFGDAFGRAGDVISQKCGVPYLYRFELMGTQQDVENVRKGVNEFWQRQPQNA